MRTLFLLVIGLVVTSGLVPGRASAQRADREYRNMVRDALSEFEDGNFEEALAMFQHAFDIRPGGRVLRGIAKTRYELRQYVECLEAVDAALAATDDPLPDELREEMTALRERASGYVGTLVLHVEPAAATMLLDGRELTAADLGAPIVVVMGAHEIEATAPEFVASHRTLDLEGGATLEVTLTLDPVPVTVVETVVEAPRGPDYSLLIAGAAVGAVGLVGVGIGIPWILDRQGAVDRCSGARAINAICHNEATVTGERDASAATLAIGGTALLVGATLLVIHFATASSGAEAPPAVTALCVPSDTGVMCAGGVRW